MGSVHPHHIICLYIIPLSFNLIMCSPEECTLDMLIKSIKSTLSELLDLLLIKMKRIRCTLSVMNIDNFLNVWEVALAVWSVGLFGSVEVHGMLVWKIALWAVKLFTGVLRPHVTIVESSKPHGAAVSS